MFNVMKNIIRHRFKKNLNLFKKHFCFYIESRIAKLKSEETNKRNKPTIEKPKKKNKKISLYN